MFDVCGLSQLGFSLNVRGNLCEWLPLSVLLALRPTSRHEELDGAGLWAALAGAARIIVSPSTFRVNA